MMTDPQERTSGNDSDAPFMRMIAWALLLVCTLLALIRPLIAYDSWAYHLPFSSYLFNIGGGAASFHFDSFMAERWLGFPKAWEWVQGLAWAITGSIYAVIVPQIMLCLAYFYYISRNYRIPAAWVILGFFTSPMLLLHFQAIYVDLPAAVCAAMAFFLFIDLLMAASAPVKIFPWWRAACAVAALGLTGNIKYTAFLAALCISAVISVLCFAIPGIPGRFRAYVVLVLATGSALAGGSVTSNFVRYGNPFYPLEFSIGTTTLFTGPESVDHDAKYPTYVLRNNREIRLPEPINFILSATELDWTMRGVPSWYSIDSVNGDISRRGARSRTGGWGALFVLANGWLLAIQMFGFRRETDRHQRLLVIGTLLLIVATACMPRAHELRYWLYIPLVILPVNLRYLSRTSHGAIVSGALIALVGYGIVQAVLSPLSQLLTYRPPTMAALRAEMPPAVLQALQNAGRYCDPGDDNLFRYSDAVTGVHGLLSRVPEDCADKFKAPASSIQHPASDR
jgi:hypothetical protein